MMPLMPFMEIGETCVMPDAVVNDPEVSYPLLGYAVAVDSAASAVAGQHVHQAR